MLSLSHILVVTNTKYFHTLSAHHYYICLYVLHYAQVSTAPNTLNITSFSLPISALPSVPMNLPIVGLHVSGIKTYLLLC